MINNPKIEDTIRAHGLWTHDLPGGVRADLSHMNLQGFDLHCANLFRANLRGADFRGADLRGADLPWADFREADLRGAYLHGAGFIMANLRGADFRGADFSGADLRGADLRGADLRGANLHKVDIVIIQTDSPWHVMIDRKYIRIGCQLYEAEQWLSFTDDEIASMDNDALRWWRNWKPLIMLTHKTLVERLENAEGSNGILN